MMVKEHLTKHNSTECLPRMSFNSMFTLFPFQFFFWILRHFFTLTFPVFFVRHKIITRYGKGVEIVAWSIITNVLFALKTARSTAKPQTDLIFQESRYLRFYDPLKCPRSLSAIKEIIWKELYVIFTNDIFSRFY